MDSEYTDLGDDWALIRPKLTGIDPELVEEMLALMADIHRWIRQGDNDEVRALAVELEERLKVSDGPRETVLRLAYMAATMVPFEIDDPEFEGEEFAFRAWRTVEKGFTVMDVRSLTEPALRVFPRKGYRIERTEEETLVTGVMEDKDNA